MSMKNLLDQYPFELLICIFEYAKLKYIIHWCEDVSFLRDNSNIKSALDYLIANGNIAYDNRFRILDRYSASKFLRKQRLNLATTLLSFQRIIDYCIEENIETNVFITYDVWSFEHIFELLEWMNISRPTRLIKYHIEIEFESQLSYDIDLTQEFNALPESFRSQIISIKLTGYHGKLYFDIDKFCNLQNFWLEDSKAKILPSFNSKAHLKRMKLSVWDLNMHGGFFLQGSLPLDLEKVVLVNGAIQELSLNPIPQNLRSIEIIKLKDNTPESQYAKMLLEQNLGNLTKLSVSGIVSSDNELIDVNQMLFHKQENFEKLKQLRSLSIQSLKFSVNLEQLNLKSLSISFVPNANIFKDFVFPSTLKEVDLQENNIEDVAIIEKALPSKLNQLDLSGNAITWGSSILNFKRFSQLKVLRLDDTQVGEHLKHLQFPDSIEELWLQDNEIRTLENIAFPRSLKCLVLDHNLITSVVRPHFPPSLKVLNLEHNIIEGYLDLTKNEKGENLEIDELYLNSNYLERFEEVHLPKTLRMLNLDHCYFTGVCDFVFPASIMHLSLTGCEIKLLRNVSWESGSQLKYISLAQNKLQEISLKFPPSVESINLSRNQISYIDPTAFNSLDCLRTLNISSNKLETFSYNFNIKSIRHLDLSFNNMRSVDLSFPRNCKTELRMLNLSINKLEKLTPFMIGHDRDFTFHDKLLEIDINGNKIRAEDVETDRQQFPASLRCLFVEYQRIPNIFGNDISKNIIYNSLCKGKRIKVPSVI
ncbi:Podocan-like protein 1 [Spathaspora sp. JA1]|nr:Podocan-like protein 1 [Spathaspora sp. JA1]